MRVDELMQSEVRTAELDWTLNQVVQSLADGHITALPVVDQHGVYSFYMEDLDHNWWEIQYYPGFQNEDLFDFGDRFSMDDGAEVGELKELNIKTSA